MSSDSSISEILTDLFRTKFPSTLYKLSFTYKGIDFVTILEMEHTDEKLSVTNSCIEIFYKPDNKSKGINPYEGVISANSSPVPCFMPRLGRYESSEVNFTPIDVLQTLKTKIGILFPNYYEVGLCITDVALKDGIFLSRFRILRGRDTVYEKYGYFSNFITALKNYVNKLTWGDIQGTHIMDNINYMLDFVNKEKKTATLLTRNELHESTKITDIISNISFQDEKNLIAKENNDFTHATLYLIGVEFLKEYNADLVDEDPLPDTYLTVEEFGKPSAWVFCLNEGSEEWKKSKDALLFTAFEEMPATSASSTERKRRTRRRKNTKNTRRNR